MVKVEREDPELWMWQQIAAEKLVCQLVASSEATSLNRLMRGSEYKASAKIIQQMNEAAPREWPLPSAGLAQVVDGLVRSGILSEVTDRRGSTLRLVEPWTTSVENGRQTTLWNASQKGKK